MININDVMEIVGSVGGYDSIATKKYLSVIENAALSVENMLKDKTYANDKRIVFLAGVKACRDISLISGGISDVTSFKVGDISITENSENGGGFGTLFESALDNCAQLLSDGGSGFAFRNV